MQDRPICFDCEDRIDHSPVYEAPCGHPRCPSVVFHGICLMRWRERREEFDRAREEFERMLRKWLSQHTEHGPRDS